MNSRGAWERLIQVAYSEGYISESVRDTCMKLVEMVWSGLLGE